MSNNGTARLKYLVTDAAVDELTSAYRLIAG